MRIFELNFYNADAITRDLGKTTDGKKIGSKNSLITLSCNYVHEHSKSSADLLTLNIFGAETPKPPNTA
jgi:hypothetical protein